jgi:hypothetical protein
MYEIVKRQGTAFTPIEDAPFFEGRATAEAWVRDYHKRHSNESVSKSEVIEARHIPGTTNA